MSEPKKIASTVGGPAVLAAAVVPDGTVYGTTERPVHPPPDAGGHRGGSGSVSIRSTITYDARVL
jgi:hypothetical protein